MSNFKMDDYVPVNERIEAFYAKWPDGTIQSEIVELTESRVTVKAYAYRVPDDARPGIGHSSLEIPGSTSFTRGSEIENAETSAWGRAIAALGFEVKRGVSSREEVRNKQPERGVAAKAQRSSPAPVSRTAEEQALLDQILAAPGMTTARMTMMADGVGVPKTRRAKAGELRQMIAQFIETPDSGVPSVDPAGGGVGTPVADNAASGEPVPDAATPPAGEVDPPDTQPEVAPDDLMDDIVAVTGGELVPPKQGTPEYAALPDGTARAKARAYWEAHPEPEPETLAEQLGAPLA